MAGKIESWFNRTIWDLSKKSFGDGVDGLPTINGTILQSILSGDNFSNEVVTVLKGLRITPVWVCVNVIAQTLSALPQNVFRSVDGKTEKLTDHPAYYPLAHEPNKYMTAPNFWLTIAIHILAWGNGFAYINRDSRSKPVSFDLWEPWKVTVTKSEGDLWYSYDGGELVNSRDVLHYHLWSFDGFCGLSPILENQNTMGMALKLSRYATLLMGAQPPGVLSYEGQLNPAQMAENRTAWEQGGPGKVKVLGGKWTYQPIMTPADETQYNLSKAQNDIDIYGIWRVPPTFGQKFERATYTNAEQSDLVFTKHTIVPICTMIEKENNKKLFFEKEKADTFTKFNVNGLLRGDLPARTAFYQAMINTGVYARNEARELEDMNGYEGGDVPLVQGAMIPGDQEGIEALRKKMETEVIPSATKPVNGKHFNGHEVLN